LFIHLLVDGHLGCFYILAIMSNAAVNIHGQVFVWMHVFNFLGYTLVNGMTSVLKVSLLSALLRID